MNRILLLTLLVLLMALAGSIYMAVPGEPPPGGALTIHDPERDLGETAVGKLTVAFRITNASALPLRVIGMNESCGNTVCFGPKEYSQIPIPAHGEILYECEIHVRKPGPFECPLDVYLEDGGIRSVALVVRGVAK